MSSLPRATYRKLSAYFELNSVRCLLLLVIGFVVRMPALQGLPIWDDDYLIGENPFAKSPLLILEAFRHYLFLDSFCYHYRPVQNFSFILDYFIWNKTYYGYHLTNVLLHVASGILLFFLLRRLLPSIAGQIADRPGALGRLSFLASLLWIVHPMHSAAIDYISGRADSLAFLFAAGGWLLFLRGRDKLRLQTRLFYSSAATFCGMLALCSREIACIWVVLFLLYTLCFDKSSSLTGKLISVSVCLLMLAAYTGLRQLPVESAPAAQQSYSGATRVVLALRALGDYARLTVWPAKLRMERDVIEPDNYKSSASWANSVSVEYLSLLGLGVLLLLTYGAIRRGTARRMRIFGVLWFAAGFLPISNLVELNATVAEHWMYLPSVGLFLFVLGIVLELRGRTQRLAYALLVLAVCGFGVRAYFRSGDWIGPRTFYERTFASGSHSVRIAVNLAIIYMNDGEYIKAEKGFRNILKLVPNYPTARNNLGEVLHRQGKNEEAKAFLAEARTEAVEDKKDYPRTWVAALKLAGLRHNEHDDARAVEILELARHEYPETWELARAESELLRETRGPEAALQVISPFAQSHWWHYGAALALGQLLAEQGDAAAAAKELRLASWLDVHDARALSLLAAMYFRQQHFEDALAAERRAVSRQPDEPSHYEFLATLFRVVGRPAEAQLALAQMADLKSLAGAGKNSSTP